MYSRFSPNFVEACRRGEFRKGEKMPCPKCGDSDVKVIDPKKWLLVAAGVGLVAVILFVLRQSAAGQVVAVASIGILAASLGTEASYTCKHCDYGWRFRDAVKWAEAIMHDEESRQR
ncbi:MAG: hypothetical protein ACM3WU_06590, partial [Bacillota bacterium]